MRIVFVLCLLVWSVSPQSAEMINIPAGKFFMGCSHNDVDCKADEGKPGGVSVYVPAFFIDPYEVTVADYRSCVKAGKCAPPKAHTKNKYCN